MLSQNEAIKAFVANDADYQRAKVERTELSTVLADYAREADATQNTVHLSGEAGNIDVEFKAKVEYDATLMRDAAQLLGNGFDNLFETVIVFKPKARPLKMFLNTVSTSEAEETAKKIIKEARIETPQSPYVHVKK